MKYNTAKSGSSTGTPTEKSRSSHSKICRQLPENSSGTPISPALETLSIPPGINHTHTLQGLDCVCGCTQIFRLPACI